MTRARIMEGNEIDQVQRLISETAEKIKKILLNACARAFSNDLFPKINYKLRHDRQILDVEANGIVVDHRNKIFILLPDGLYKFDKISDKDLTPSINTGEELCDEEFILHSVSALRAIKNAK